jgi:hypothetical protein
MFFENKSVIRLNKMDEKNSGRINLSKLNIVKAQMKSNFTNFRKNNQSPNFFLFDDLSRPNVELDKRATPSQTKQKFEEKFEGGWCMCSQDNRLLNSCLTLKKKKS